MTLYLAENIKQLRQKGQLTQEQLANILGVSPQAVSRWECGATMPDIGLLPDLADVFSVSLEELLGVEKSRQEERISELKEQFDEAMNHGRVNDCIEIARIGVKEYPRSCELQNLLMYALFVSTADDGNVPGEENLKKYKNEIIELGESILRNSADDALRVEVKERLGFHYIETGEREKGRKMLESLPGMRFCREFDLYYALEGDERMEHLGDMIKTYTYNLVWDIWRYAMNSGRGAEERLSLMGKMEAVVRDVFPENELGSWYYLLPKLYVAGMMPLNLELGRKDAALDLLERAADYLEVYEALPDGRRYQAPPFDYTHFEKYVHTADSRTQTQIVLEELIPDPSLDSIRGEKRFQDAVGKMKALC